MLGLEDASLGVFCPCVCKPPWFNSNSGSAGIPEEKICSGFLPVGWESAALSTSPSSRLSAKVSFSLLWDLFDAYHEWSGITKNRQMK